MRYISAVLLVAAVILTAADRAVAQTGRELFQQALVKERANGDLRGAIVIYERIVRDFASDRSLAASALVQLGECYEKLGSTEAERAYQRVVSDYADQGEFVARARVRLAELRSAATASTGPVARRVLSGDDTDENDFVEMYPSLDGRRVAYVNMWDGAVYVRDLTSGEVQKLTSGLPEVWHYFPHWSPDGRRIAATEEDQATNEKSIVLIDVATHEVATLAGSKSQSWIDVSDWSRDGRYLLCGRAHQLALIAMDDGALTVLADSVFRGGSLSPGSRFVAYALGDKENSQIYVQALEGGARRQITDAPGSDFHPLWSPDGRAIAYQRGDEIWVVPIADGLVAGSPKLVHTTGGSTLRAWTEQGLYYTLWNSRAEAVVPYQVSVDPATGEPGPGGVQVLPVPHPNDFWEFAWSPDMRQVAFSYLESPARLTIYSADRKGGETFDLGLEGQATDPRWSADGQEIQVQYFQRLPSGQGYAGTVMAVDVTTHRTRELIRPVPRVRSISLSADGRRMAFARQEESEGAGLPPVTRGAGTRVEVSETGRFDGRVVAGVGSPGEGRDAALPMISPSGDQVVYVRQRPTTTPGGNVFAPDAGSLWLVASDGSGSRRLATAPLMGYAIWDPTGRFVAYTAKQETGPADGPPYELRVVNVATGVSRQIPLPGLDAYHLSVVDWSRDGRLIGVVARGGEKWEYWVLQGLEEAVR